MTNQDTPRSGSKTEGSEAGSKKGEKDRKQKEFFREELRRLKEGLDKEKEKIQTPEEKDYTPYTFNALAPYSNVHTTEFLMDLPEGERHQFVGRKTATGLCDPWVALEMDLQPPKRPDPHKKKEEGDEEEDEEKSEDKKEKREPKEGSTHLPKYPCVNMPAGELGRKELHFDDVPELREFVKNTYSTGAKAKIDAEYKRTKQDFNRMELDKMKEYHPVSRPNMRAAYFAYLQNNPGSKKAVYECVRAAEKSEKEEKEGK